ncbi:uncharacterized protein LOC128388565 isoform X2 [Panonychus citri]|nr:uncharacterized protein LOC128388565 isoform X2 [Panonychus citri]
MVDLLDARQCFITRLSVSPSWLKADVYSRQSEKPRLRSLRFILNRANQLPTIGSIRLAHDSYFPVGGYIFLHSLEIRNIIENTLTQIPVFKRIYVLPPDANELDQVFHAHHHFADKKKDEITSGYAPHLTFSETLLFIFFYSNTTLFTTIFSPSYMEISSLTEAAYNGLIGIIPSSTFTAMFLILYRFIVKNSYAKSKAIGSWSVVRIIFLTTLTANGLIIGLTSSYIQSRQTPHTLTYWSLSILIANFSLGALILPLIVIRFIIDSLIVYRSSQKLASTPSLASKVVDETKPDDRQSSIIGSLLRIKRRTGSNKGLESMVDEHSKSKISKTGQHVSKNDDDMEENSKLEKMVIQKRSMEEGLSETPETGNIKSPRVRIMSRIHGVLGRPSKEPRSQEEEKIFDIDKRIEDQSHRD